MKIAIVGYSGAGKSTLAKQLGHILQLPVLHLDKVQFLPGWLERPRNEANAMVQAFMEQPHWIIDGNYTNFAYAERLAAADKIVFLDFGRLNCFARACKRYKLTRGTSRDSMTDGCNEKMDTEFILWLLRDGRSAARRQAFAAMTKAHSNKVTILHNQRELDAYYTKMEEYAKTAAIRL